MATQPKETFGQRVKRLREAITIEEAGKKIVMPQRVLARECKCSLDTISRIERDVQKPTPATLAGLAKALNTTTDYLMEVY